MLSLTVLLLWAVASIAVVAGDCTVKESFQDCIKPALKFDSCVDKDDVKCACKYTYVESDCYDAYCSEETNPAAEARRQCDMEGAHTSTSPAVNKSTSDILSKESSLAAGSGSSSAVPSAGLPMAAVAAVAIASTLGLVWQL